MRLIIKIIELMLSICSYLVFMYMYMYTHLRESAAMVIEIKTFTTSFTYQTKWAKEY